MLKSDNPIKTTSSSDKTWQIFSIAIGVNKRNDKNHRLSYFQYIKDPKLSQKVKMDSYPRTSLDLGLEIS
jgi:hypothetical protein